jgi:hypothetical protein
VQKPGDEQGDSEPSSKRQCTGGVQQGVELAQDGVVKEVQDETAKGVQEAKGVVRKLSLHERWPGVMEMQADEGEVDWSSGLQSFIR